MITVRFVTLGALLAIAACGYSSAGDGNDTLEVIAQAITDANEGTTRVSLRVFDVEGEPISDAEVTITDGVTDESDPLELLGDGVYEGELEDALERVEIQVERPNGDFVSGRLEGPGPHTILLPQDEGSHPLNQDLPVRWGTSDGLAADHVVIHLHPRDFEGGGDFDTVVIDDTGVYTVPQIFLRAGEADLGITRTNALPLARGLRASSLAVGFTLTSRVNISTGR